MLEEISMGAWAEDAFGNDAACDWAGDFAENPSLGAIEEAIQTILSTDEYLDSHEACEGLVAIEIVARLKGNWGERSAYSEAVDKWVESVDVSPSAELLTAAENAITRILAEDSELQELWDEGDVNQEWHREMDDLLSRVKS